MNRSMIVALTAMCLPVAAAPPRAESPAATQPAWEPTSAYRKHPVEGWPVYVNNRFLTEHPKLAAATLKEVRVQLFRIKRVIPEDKVSFLQKTAIWIEYRRKKRGAAAFHPSRRWLKNHGVNPDKAEGIEILHAENFLAWSKHAQPWMLLHELAHALDWRLYRHNNARLKKAYAKHKATGTFDKVLIASGRSGKHYAMSNHKEFFAEFTESYFGRNDIFPFTQAELKKVSPEIAGLIRDIWQRPISHVPTQRYHVHRIEGWTVLVNPAFATDHPKMCKEALGEVAAQLYRIRRVLPADKVTFLQDVRIWVEFDSVSPTSAVFHPFRTWLVENNLNPDKTGGIEICNAERFLTWTRDGLPWMLLHELAHAYDWRTTGYRSEKIHGAWQKLVATDTYRTVLNFNGATREHNGRTNHMEFFAEFTETYFGRNEMYPFIRAQLRAESPGIEKLIREIWTSPIPTKLPATQPTTRPAASQPASAR